MLGEFIISENKWIGNGPKGGTSNVGLGVLSSTVTDKKQLSQDLMFEGGIVGSNALTRTPGLSPEQTNEIFEAFQAGNVRTQLVVVKPHHVGAGITQKLTDDATFGTKGSEQLGDIVIIEVPIGP